MVREKELERIRRELNGDGTCRIVVLHGLGGVGKTQLSIAYAKRHKDNYSAIFWLNIKDKNLLKQSFARIGGQILREHPSSRLSTVDMKGNLEDLIDVIKEWLSLSNNTRWLMIFDNYDNPKLLNNTDPSAVDIHKCLPESYQGSIIITSRLSQIGMGHTIPIKKLVDIQDSLDILSNTSGRERLKNGKKGLQ